ncbi:MAG: hypothetical protein WAO18_01965 [Mycobacterium sp.]
MTDDHHVAEADLLDVRDDGIDPLADRGGAKVSRLYAAAGQIHRECLQLGGVLVQFGDRGFPVVAAVHKHGVCQRHQRCTRFDASESASSPDAVIGIPLRDR